MRILSPYEVTHLRRYKPTLLEAVARGEYGDQPVEYITGKVEFAGKVFKVSPAVLIPRVETEELVERALFTIQKLYRPGKKLVVVDVGTGSGAIGLSLWSKCHQLGLKNIAFYLLDIEPTALTIARENYRLIRDQLVDQTGGGVQSRLATNVSFLESNLLANFLLGIKIDVLLANLPYIPSARIPHLDKSVRLYEPLLALDGGADGLFYIHALLRQAVTQMNRKGVCWLEIDDTHTAVSIGADDELRAARLRVEVTQDCFGKTRFARCYFGSKNSNK